jgi:CO/xanthine dehydrogenase Mo-binding subunit
MNKLAELLGMDPVELRMKNVLHDNVPTHVGSPLPEGVTIEETLQVCSQRAGWVHRAGSWQRPPARKPSSPQRLRGLGLACGMKNVGFSFGAPENCAAIVELHGSSEIERVVLRHAGAEVGQGAHTAMAQMVAEAVGVPLSRVDLVMSDTATSGDSGSASASRLTFMSGNSIRGAVEAALKAWNDEERPAIGEYVYRPPATTMFDPETGQCVPNFCYGYVAQVVDLEVDSETGQIDIIKVISAHDVGRAINPQQVEGQIEGGVVQAQGYAIMENFQMREGRVVTDMLSTYLIPTILDIPHEVEGLILEYNDRIGPWGARGMAEMPFIPFTPAVTAALHDATGIWFDSIPLTPDHVVSHLREAGIGV